MTRINSLSHLSFKRQVSAMIALFSLMMIALVPSVSEARGPHGEGPSEERILGHLQYRLKLTPEQMEKVRPIVQDESTKMKALKAEHHKKVAESRAEFRKEMDAHRNRMGERLNDILTPEQKEEYRKMNEERQAWHKERMEKKGQRGQGCKK